MLHENIQEPQASKLSFLTVIGSCVNKILFEVKRNICLPFSDTGQHYENCDSSQQHSLLESLQQYQIYQSKQPLPPLQPLKPQQPLPLQPQYYPPSQDYTQPQDDYFTPSEVDDVFSPSASDINIAIIR